MSDQLYEMLSIGLRYWFVLLGLLIVARSFLWLRRDRREKHERLRRLPDAGMIGQLVVERGTDELPEGTAIPLPNEGYLGCLRSSDVFIPSDTVAREHLYFEFHPGRGLEIRPMRGCTCICDGVTRSRKHPGGPLLHGSLLEAGDVLLRVRFFAGIDVADAPVTETLPPIHQDQPLERLREPPVPPAWREDPQPYSQGTLTNERPDNPWIPKP